MSEIDEDECTRVDLWAPEGTGVVLRLSGTDQARQSARRMALKWCSGLLRDAEMWTSARYLELIGEGEPELAQELRDLLTYGTDVDLSDLG